jgi:Ca-activated chloride channel family protein
MPSASGARLAGCVCLLVIASTAAEHAQQFKSGVAMVALSVSVTDGRGCNVSGLSAENFAVYEDGVQQPVSLFGSDRVPLDVAIVLDTSGSMASLLPLVKHGARDLLARLREGDRATMIEVKRGVEVRRELTRDLASVGSAIDAVGASGTTALYDGLYLSLRQFERERRLHPELRRQALVLFSDGYDTTSHLGFDEIAGVARSADVAVYTITPDYRYVSPLDPGFDRRRNVGWEMRTLSRDTGGLAFFPAKAEDLKPVYDTIAHDLVNQYAVGYLVPRPDDSRKFRQVAVRLVPPVKGVARTRVGYAAAGDDAAAMLPDASPPRD